MTVALCGAGILSVPKYKIAKAGLGEGYGRLLFLKSELPDSRKEVWNDSSK